MTTSKKYDYLLCCHQEKPYSTSYFVLSFGRQEAGKIEIDSCPNDGEAEWRDSPKHLHGLQLHDLRKDAFIHSSEDRKPVWTDWHYKPLTVHLPKAQRMVKTLEKIDRHLTKECAFELGDVVVAICRLFKIKQVAIFRDEEFQRRTGSRWWILDVPRGREAIREEFEKFREAAKTHCVD